MGYSVENAVTNHQGYVARKVTDSAECLNCGKKATHQYKGVRDGKETWTDAYCGPKCARASVGHHTKLVAAEGDLKKAGFRVTRQSPTPEEPLEKADPEGEYHSAVASLKALTGRAPLREKAKADARVLAAVRALPEDHPIRRDWNETAHPSKRDETLRKARREDKGSTYPKDMGEPYQKLPVNQRAAAWELAKRGYKQGWSPKAMYRHPETGHVTMAMQHPEHGTEHYHIPNNGSPSPARVSGPREGQTLFHTFAPHQTGNEKRQEAA